MQTNDFIRHVDRELDGLAQSTFSPRQFPTLPGTESSACLLPDFRSESAFEKRYGRTYSSHESSANLGALGFSMEEATAVVNEFARFAASNCGSDVLDAAEATLRRLSRIEQSIEPLFAGLTMASFGRARMACIAARAAVGNILDQKSLANEV